MASRGGESQALRVLMVVHNYYPRDIRVRREAEALVGAGHEVEVICLRDEGERPRDQVAGVRVRRLPVQRHRESGVGVYLLEYGWFAVLAAIAAGRRLFGRRFDLFHAHNPPDLLLLLGWPARWFRGTRLVLDVHDVMSHLFASRFGTRSGAWREAALRGIEGFCYRQADLVVTVHEDYRRLLADRGVPPSRIVVAMNVPDDRLFDCERHAAVRPPSDRFVIVYHGLLAERGGVDLLVRAVAALKGEIPHLELRIAGWGPMEGELRRLSTELELDGTVRFLGRMAWDDIPALLRGAHLACVPNRADAINRYALNNKILECVAMGLPVIASRSEALVRYFGPDQIAFIDPGNLDELVQAVRTLARDPDRRARLAEAAHRFHREHRWSLESRHMVAALQDLAARGSQA